MPILNRNTKYKNRDANNYKEMYKNGESDVKLYRLVKLNKWKILNTCSKIKGKVC